MAGSPIFADIVLLLALSVPAVLVFRWIRLPSAAGFLVVRVLVGPHALGWLEDAREVEPLAELGVALLLSPRVPARCTILGRERAPARERRPASGSGGRGARG